MQDSTYKEVLYYDIYVLLIQHCHPVYVKYCCIAVCKQWKAISNKTLKNYDYIEKSSYIREIIRDNLYFKMNFNFSQYKMSLCNLAVEANNVPMLQYFVEKGYSCYHTHIHAVAYGRIDCLKYLHEVNCPWNVSLCSMAASEGHLDCLKYLHENQCPWDVCTCEYAAANGHLTCLRYAHEHGCPWNKRTYILALEKRHYHCLTYLHEHGCPWDALLSALFPLPNDI